MTDNDKKDALMSGYVHFGATHAATSGDAPAGWMTPNDWGKEPLITSVESVVAAWRADNREVTPLYAHIERAAAPDFRDAEELATWLDSLRESDAIGTVSNRKWEPAQRAAAAIRAASPATASGDERPPTDCSGNPASCPDNEGYGCHCGYGVTECVDAAPTPYDWRKLLIEVRAVLETWKDTVPAVSLRADIDKALAAPPDTWPLYSGQEVSRVQRDFYEAGRAAVSAATKPTADLAHLEGLADLFGAIAAKHGIEDISVNKGAADELFPHVLAEFIVAASRGAEPDHTFEHLAGRGLHELRTDELPAYLASVAHNFGARSTEFSTAAQWVATEIERKTNDERILAVKCSELRSLLATKPAAVPAVPADYVRMPRRPTKEMLDPFWLRNNYPDLARAYEAMLAAAPSATPAAQDQAKAGPDVLAIPSAIMNIPCLPEKGWGVIVEEGYRRGHRDARHAAAALVSEFASRFRAQGGNTNADSSGIATPAASSDAASTADQVRNEALEEAAKASEKVQDDYREHQSHRWPEMRDDAETGAAACVTAIRALKSAATQTTEGAGNA